MPDNILYLNSLSQTSDINQRQVSYKGTGVPVVNVSTKSTDNEIIDVDDSTKGDDMSDSKEYIDARLEAIESKFDSKLDKAIYEFKAHVDNKFIEVKSEITDLKVEFTSFKSELSTDLKWVKSLLLIVIAGVFIPMVAQFWQSNITQQAMQPAIEQSQPAKK